MNKFFKISISKQERQQSRILLGDQIGQYFSNISKILQANNHHQNEQLKKLFKTVMHFVYQLQKYTCVIPKSQPMKVSLINSMESIQAYLCKISSEMEVLRKYYKQQELNLGNIKRKRQIVEEQQLINLQKMTKIQQQISSNSLIAKYKGKVNQLDFQLKKNILKVQQLQQQIRSYRQKIEKLNSQNRQMKKQKQNIQKWKQDYQYKIRKLKQQLQVAHIVKEQNLQDKFNYILGWKL